MKKTVSILAGVLCLMACNKVEEPSNSNTLSAVASIDTQTKTAYTDNGVGNGLKVDWAESDSFTAYYKRLLCVCSRTGFLSVMDR